MRSLRRHKRGEVGVLVDKTFVLVLVVLVTISLVLLFLGFGDGLSPACTPKDIISGNMGILGRQLRAEGSRCCRSGIGSTRRECRE